MNKQKPVTRPANITMKQARNAVAAYLRRRLKLDSQGLIAYIVRTLRDRSLTSLVCQPRLEWLTALGPQAPTFELPYKSEQGKSDD